MLGPETLTALERRLDIDVSRRATSLECSCASLELIVSFEAGSRQRYERRFRRPTWPGGMSGVTIGIGYDLGMTPKAQIRSDWERHLSESELAALLAVQGVTGAAVKRLLRRLALVIPFAVAEEVFYLETLPHFAARTRAALPGVTKLPADAQGAMLSLVYNRGASLLGEQRREMAEIATLLRSPEPDLEAIAGQFESMKQLWPDMKGLRDRRQREAEEIRGAIDYAPAKSLASDSREAQHQRGDQQRAGGIQRDDHWCVVARYKAVKASGAIPRRTRRQTYRPAKRRRSAPASEIARR